MFTAQRTICANAQRNSYQDLGGVICVRSSVSAARLSIIFLNSKSLTSVSQLESTLENPRYSAGLRGERYVTFRLHGFRIGRAGLDAMVMVLGRFRCGENPIERIRSVNN